MQVGGFFDAPDFVEVTQSHMMADTESLGEAGVGDVLKQLPDPPSYSAVRTMIRLLESKGFLKHRQDGTRYVYRPIESKETARKSALRHLIQTFFSESPSDAVAAILDDQSIQLSNEELDQIQNMINQARKEDR